MVGLLEHMDHIDDYENHEVFTIYRLILRILRKTGQFREREQVLSVGGRDGFWARSNNLYQSWADSGNITNGNRNFTLVGDKDAFYLQMPVGTNGSFKRIYGAGFVRFMRR